MVQQSIHSDTVLGEVHLKVSDLERSLRFYQDVVGLRVLTQAANRAELTVDGIKPLVVLHEISTANIVPRRSAAGLYHFAILLPDRRSLGLSLRNLIDSGIHIGQADHLVSEALYIADPDNNGIEIYRDRPRESWTYDAQGNVKMATDPIDWDGLLKEAEGHPWTGMPVGTIIGHIHFHVSDLQKSKEFYCDILGFDIIANMSATMGALFISAGGYHHHIGLNVWAGIGAPPAPVDGTGLKYYKVVVPGEQELQRILANLRSGGYAVTEQNATWIVKDPSQIELRLTLQSK
ncbi:VOC family protein [Paenibacillus agricola]|uniref:VOC family protein n=1 Tax=Paenibacillus agricola TaxID=2716264 RepID=A0ABX0JEF4_9BACL|nr:VOC family protein [Paenibacillus agricola]NHN33616.1 VOC family protein [Paenibacillus agricola]